MANYAVIENGKVIDCILADTKEIAESATNKECIEFSNEPIIEFNLDRITVGWSWDGIKFTPPVQEIINE